MRLQSLILTLVLTSFLAVSSFAQNNITSTQELHLKVAEYALEVYGDFAEYQTPQHLLLYSAQIKRVSVVSAGNSAASFPSLETVDLRSKYNPNLTLDKEGFDPSNFNPIKYHFEFYNSEVQKFRVGNTGYIVIISSYQQ